MKWHQIFTISIHLERFTLMRLLLERNQTQLTKYNSKKQEKRDGKLSDHRKKDPLLHFLCQNLNLRIAILKELGKPQRWDMIPFWVIEFLYCGNSPPPWVSNQRTRDLTDTGYCHRLRVDPSTTPNGLHFWKSGPVF